MTGEKVAKAVVDMEARAGLRDSVAAEVAESVRAHPPLDTSAIYSRVVDALRGRVGKTWAPKDVDDPRFIAKTHDLVREKLAGAQKDGAWASRPSFVRDAAVSGLVAAARAAAGYDWQLVSEQGDDDALAAIGALEGALQMFDGAAAGEEQIAEGHDLGVADLPAFPLRAQLAAAWDAVREAGHSFDADESLAEVLREILAPDPLAEAEREAAEHRTRSRLRERLLLAGTKLRAERALSSTLLQALASVAVTEVPGEHGAEMAKALNAPHRFPDDGFDALVRAMQRADEFGDAAEFDEAGRNDLLGAAAQVVVRYDAALKYASFVAESAGSADEACVVGKTHGTSLWCLPCAGRLLGEDAAASGDGDVGAGVEFVVCSECGGGMFVE